MSAGEVLNMGNGITPVDLRQTGPGVPGLDAMVTTIYPTRKRNIMEPSRDQLFNLEDTSVARKHRRIEKPGVGETISFNGSPIDGFRAGLAKTPYLHTPITVPQRIVNQKKPYTRLVQRGANGMPVLDTISKYKFAFLKRTPIDTRRSAFSQALREVLQVTIEDGTRVAVDLRPMTLFEGSILNYYLYLAQRALFDKNPEAFYDLTAADIMNEWSFDGLVISEEMLNGAESSKTSGFALHGGQWFGGDGVKVATINMAGEDLCANVFGAQVMHGSGLYFGCKKFDVDTGGFHFNLNAKSDANGMIMMSQGDPAALNNVAAKIRFISGLDPARIVGAQSAKSRGFKPWLIYFISQPDDQQLALEHVAMTDEYGVRRYDSYHQHIGTTIIAPQGHEPQPHVLDRITLNSNANSSTSDLLLDVDPTGALYSATASTRRPGVCVDAALGLDQPFIKIYLNPRGNNPLNN